MVVSSCLAWLLAACSGPAYARPGPDADEDPIGGTAGDESGGVDEDTLEPGDEAEFDGAPCRPALIDPVPIELEEERAAELELAVRWCDDAVAERRVWVTDLPPGARWDEPTRQLHFRPDFTQGGERFDLRVTLDDGLSRVETGVSLDILDTVTPPEPEIVGEYMRDGYRRIVVRQVTDEFLDAPGYAGRTFDAILAVPHGEPPAEGWPVRVALHGFSAPSPNLLGWSREIRLAPHDPDNTYWWGYGDSLPEAAPGPDDEVPDYTARRVLHLVDWVNENVDGADPDRVYLTGSSMGGAGALTMGILHARHFAWIRSELGQTVPRLHRAPRIAQLSGWWGEAGVQAAWERMDLTRRIAEGDADDALVFTRHGKDDRTIEFSALVGESPATGRSFIDALQTRHIGHHVVWDEGGHGSSDPVLGREWWDDAGNLVHDDEVAVSRTTPFVAFGRSSLDDNPGEGLDGGPGNDDLPGDSGWDGDMAGVINRHLRWRGHDAVDRIDEFAIWVRAYDGHGYGPPRSGYPTRGDRIGGELPVVVDVTPRRVQHFRCRPGERVRWRYGTQSGIALADERGAVTIEDLQVGIDWNRLVLTRE